MQMMFGKMNSMFDKQSSVSVQLSSMFDQQKDIERHSNTMLHDAS